MLKTVLDSAEENRRRDLGGMHDAYIYARINIIPKKRKRPSQNMYR